MFKTLSLLFLSFFTLLTFAGSSEYRHCWQDPSKQKLRAQEIHELFVADQRDRENFESLNQQELHMLAENDLIRRKRIGEIFAEGCFKHATDYLDAAYIFQHGDVPDHYFQAFVWANKADELGEPNAKHLAAIAIDRYLIHTGHRQLFASQAIRNQETQGCYCLQEVENTFPDSQRVQMSGVSLQARINWVKSLNEGKNCTEVFCSTHLKPTPKGSIAGYW